MTSPTLIIFAGANGSGKTTASKQLLPELGITEFVNADNMAKEISPDNPSQKAVRAGRLVLDQIEGLIGQGGSFAIETTLSGKTLAKIIKQASTCGYRVEMHYIFCSDIEVNLARIKNRVLQGGHDVPEKDVRRRYWRSLKNLISPYFDLCDIIALYDTTEGALKPFGEKFDHDSYTAYDSDLMSRFAEKLRQANATD